MNKLKVGLIKVSKVGVKRIVFFDKVKDMFKNFFKVIELAFVKKLRVRLVSYDFEHVFRNKGGVKIRDWLGINRVVVFSLHGFYKFFVKIFVFVDQK